MATIEIRKSKGGGIVYRAKVRRQGQPKVSETFATRSAAKAWAAKTEADMRDSGYAAGAGRTLAEAIDRYSAERLLELRDQKTSSCHLR